jgi:hypothetical protein
MSKTARLMISCVLMIACLLTVGAVGAVAEPAAAAGCATPAYVHARPLGVQPIYRWETDPVPGTATALRVDVPPDGDYAVTVNVGGGGLKPTSRPVWVIYQAGKPVGQMDGNPAGNDCASSDRTYGIVGGEGDSYLIKASYTAGNSGVTVTGQNHISIFYV